MCLAVPAQVKSISGNEAEVDIGGNKYQASIMLTPEVKVGDFVLLHTGYAISIIDREDAEETLHILHEMDRLSQSGS